MADLQIVNATKTYGAVGVLNRVNLEISSGEFVVFVGPSGCGKSTLLRMISGLEDISSGEIWLDGRVVNDVDPAKRGVAMVFQNYALYPHMTVFDNMAFSLTMAGAPKKERKERVEKAAEILRLGHLLDRRPGQLSGGQKQRVAIGRAIVREPKVFLFDEPLSNLDAELRVQMRAELVQLHAKLKSTMIYVTHDQVEAMTLADKMVVMNGGIIQQVGRPLDLYDDPDNKFVAGFIGTPKMNFLNARVAQVSEDRLRLTQVGGTETGTLEVPFQHLDPSIKEVQIGVRPEHVRILSEPDGAESLPVAVTLVEELGDMTVIHTDLPNGEHLTAQSHGGRYSGSPNVHAKVDVGRILLFDRDGSRLRSARLS